MIKIRLLSSAKPAWYDPRIEFNPDFEAADSDGLLIWGGMKPEFFNYKGVRAWFIDEPRTQGMFGSETFKRAMREMDSSEFLHHSNPDSRYRFPCATHYGEPSFVRGAERKNAAIAVVNNFGGRLWRMRDQLVVWTNDIKPRTLTLRGVNLRNRFILHPGVDLFGDPKAWSGFRQWPWSKPGFPSNYRGAHGHWWLDRSHIEALARYRVVICLENASLPYYFTEKLVNAARAGCVPIYHAHPTVRQKYLEHAAWIDPADYGFDPSATLKAALNCDAEKIREQNREWLGSEAVRSTDGWNIWSQIAEHFIERLGRAKEGSATKVACPD